ncbi:GNAT family N-acetyltransferase [Streptomyces sp. B1866]|uniref:GNAT family N-acetyltransferase n=1 Tax=Streptomyces sp. B1866 TaxID=3075431 RepID=UPI002891C6C0|nr:GNAT family N-acetyltransferase [Streptomyces sp. B1866]MDT3399945.1 GNAT family N-acetyltransferase [Streptomyces sp. B1866]
MTTTLRPTGPERRTDGGGRSRSYAVCVNSRPVGTVRLTTDVHWGTWAGRIENLAIDEPDRRRGRGTVAALAAEEVLRGWGCAQAVVSVPASAAPALSLAAALGYAQRGRTLVKELSGPVPLPADSRVRPMGDAEYGPWLARERAGYVRDWRERGLTDEQAEARGEAGYAALYQGPATPGAALRVLVHGGADVGTLWVALGGGLPDGVDAYVYAVEVAEEYRGRGHGRTLMLVAEREALAAGARTLGLHVFAGYTPAERLYASLGYRATDVHLHKPLL